MGVCACSHRPLTLNGGAKWVSIPFQMLRQLLFEKGEPHLNQQQKPCRTTSLLTSPDRTAMHCFSVRIHVQCLYVEQGWRGEGRGEWTSLLCTTGVKGKYIKVCRQLVKQSWTGAINCVGPCKHNSLSAKRCLAGAPLL